VYAGLWPRLPCLLLAKSWLAAVESLGVEPWLKYCVARVAAGGGSAAKSWISLGQLTLFFFGFFDGQRQNGQSQDVAEQ
jgi:hypothetical protein